MNMKEEIIYLHTSPIVSAIHVYVTKSTKRSNDNNNNIRIDRGSRPRWLGCKKEMIAI